MKRIDFPAASAMTEIKEEARTLVLRCGVWDNVKGLGLFVPVVLNRRPYDEELDLLPLQSVASLSRSFRYCYG
jgi:hypothetical protein